MSKTKIIATLGPASQNPRILKAMAISGMKVARINFSHGNLQNKIRLIYWLKHFNRRLKSTMKILGDLEGYRIRVGRLKEPLGLKKGEILFFTQDDIVGSQKLIPFDYWGDLKDIRAGNFVYIDDGNIALSVLSNKAKLLKLKVNIPGILKSFKGINIPAAKLHFSGLTDKDNNDIIFSIKHNLDFIAQSFVRNAEDILKVRALLKLHHSDCRVIAKIENRQGIKNIDEIIQVSDGIMIARGDLGVSLPIYEVPILQKEIIKKCKKSGKFVITATQMLESMTDNLRPTRAEVSDVANAVLDGSDYIMLSAETAVGNYPVESVRMMERTISFTEKHQRRL